MGEDVCTHTQRNVVLKQKNVLTLILTWTNREGTMLRERSHPQDKRLHAVPQQSSSETQTNMQAGCWERGAAVQWMQPQFYKMGKSEHPAA